MAPAGHRRCGRKSGARWRRPSRLCPACPKPAAWRSAAGPPDACGPTTTPARRRSSRSMPRERWGGRVRVMGADVGDWEDISVGPCADGDVSVHRRHRRQQPDPAPHRDLSRWRARAERCRHAARRRARGDLSRRAHDAEAVFVTGRDEGLHRDEGGCRGHRAVPVPKPLRAGALSRLELVRRLALVRVTDAEASPDGTWVALRTTDDLFVFATRDLVGGAAVEPRRFDLRRLGEPQGEGVALGPDGSVYLVGEGGRGTYARLRCTLR